MKRYLTVFAALAMSLLSSGVVPSLKASESDKKTIITISQPVTVEGTLLPAGQYVPDAAGFLIEPGCRLRLQQRRDTADHHGPGHSRVPAAANR
jgi:hypothetical protein